MTHLLWSFSFLLLLSFSGIAQQSKIDSLEKWVTNYPKQDTIWVKNMIKLEALYEREIPKKEGAFADIILDYSKKNNYVLGIEEGLLHKANGFSYKGQYQKAIETILEKLNVDTKNNDLIRKIESYTILATTFGKANKNGSQEKTLEYFLLAHETALKIPSKHPKRSREIAKAKINVASGYFFTEQYEKALKIYLEASAIERNEINNLKNSPEKQREIAYLNTVSSLNIGSLYYLLNRFEEAEKSYLNGIELATKYNFDGILVQLYNSIGETYVVLNKFDLAKKYLVLVDQIGTQDKLETTSMLIHLETYEKYYAKIKDFENAYNYQKKRVALNDSLKGTELQQKIKDLTIKYETDKKEQENKQLTEKNQTIEKQNRTYLIALVIFLLLLGIAVFLYFQLFKSKKQLDILNVRLSETNQQKDKLFKIISHDLKTPATTFVQLTNTINHYINTKQFEKLNELGSNAQFLANDLQAIVNNLLYWSMSQQGVLTKRLEKVYVEDIVEELKDAYTAHCQLHHIEFGIERPERIELMANRVHLSTVLRNIVSNAMKFTPDGEKILMVITSNPTHTEIALHDAGKGFSQEELQQFEESQKLESKTGLHGEKGTGLGLTIVNEIVKLYGGTIFITNSELLKGACVIISFKS